MICQIKNSPTLNVPGVVLVDGSGGDFFSAHNTVLHSEFFFENVMIFSVPTDDGEMPSPFFFVDRR